MNSDNDPLFPESLSDEAASVLCDFLHELAFACDSHYFAQLHRYHEKQRTIYDPEHPWRSPPPYP